MAKKNILVDIDFNKNQLLNPVLQNLPEDPSTGVEGQKYFNTTNHIERIYRNGAWQNSSDEYVLPAASTNTRGGVKVGNRLYIENEDVLNVHRASKVIEGIGRFATDAEVEAGTQPNVAIDPVQLKSVIDGLPVPMQFKGTVGTGGTYDSNTLPAASTGNTGWTLKVISDGTYQGVTAEAGDTLISNGTTWVLIPSGDEPAQIQADWNQTDNTALDYIKNKPDVALKTDVEDLQEDVEELQNGYFIPGWRTPTSAEWDYIINSRSASTVSGTDNARYAKAQINSINGLILLPNVFELPTGITMLNINTRNATASDNTYTISQWETLENTGCIFLPCSGYREGTTMSNINSYGFYSSTKQAYTATQTVYLFLHSGSSGISITYTGKRMGKSVRLIKENTEGAFSVSSTLKADIAKSNLQFHCLNKKWRFAPNAYDVIGNDNSNIAENYNGYIDLFGFGTSGWNSDAVCYQPWSSSTNDANYINHDLTGDYKNADWGVFATNKQLQDVAFTGDYNDLENKPDLTVYKTKQTPVTDPTASGTSFTFISSITQNANGEIVANKKNLPIPVPTVSDEDKLLSVNSSGEYELITIINSELIPY